MIRHCPSCGRGLSAKYRGKEHPRYFRPRYRKNASQRVIDSFPPCKYGSKTTIL